MKRLLSCLLVLLLLLGHGALAEADADAALRAAVSSEYPGWNIWQVDRYGSGTWQGEMAMHCEIGLFRLTDRQLELKSLYALMNPLKEGDRIPWQASDWVTVPLAGEAFQRIAGMPADAFSGYGSGFWLPDEALRGCADFLLEPGMAWYELIAYPDVLVGLAVNQTGHRSLRIARWDGSAYTQLSLSPPQEAELGINPIHSYNDALEMSTDHLEFYMQCGADGIWRIDGINTGYDIVIFRDGAIVDITVGSNDQNNSSWHYGRPDFPTSIDEMNLRSLPQSLEEAVSRLDAQGLACARMDAAGLYDAPGGERLADCYARTVGRVLERRDEWVRLQIGDAVQGLSGWFRSEELAFGRDINAIACGFPSYLSGEQDCAHLLSVLPNVRLSPGDRSNDVWLIGRAPDGRWLVQVNEQQVLFAPETAFTHIGPPEREE